MHGIFDSFHAINQSTAWEIRGFDMLHQFINGNFPVINICNTTINYLRKVMWQHVRGHTYSNTAASIYEEMGNAGWKHGWFFQRVVKIKLKINCVLVNVIHHVTRHTLESGFCITHGSRTFTVRRAEVSLLVDCWITSIPLLPHSYQGIVNSCITVWMVFTEYFTYNPGTFTGWFVEIHPEFIHRKKYSSVNGF